MSLTVQICGSVTCCNVVCGQLVSALLIASSRAFHWSSVKTVVAAIVLPPHSECHRPVSLGTGIGVGQRVVCLGVDDSELVANRPEPNPVEWHGFAGKSSFVVEEDCCEHTVAGVRVE